MIIRRAASKWSSIRAPARCTFNARKSFSVQSTAAPAATPPSHTAQPQGTASVVNEPPPKPARSDWYYIGLLSLAASIVGIPLLVIAELQDDPVVRAAADRRFPWLLPQLRQFVSIPEDSPSGWLASEQPKGEQWMDIAIASSPGASPVVKRVRAYDAISRVFAGTGLSKQSLSSLSSNAVLVVAPAAASAAAASRISDIAVAPHDRPQSLFSHLGVDWLAPHARSAASMWRVHTLGSIQNDSRGTLEAAHAWGEASDLLLATASDARPLLADLANGAVDRCHAELQQLREISAALEAPPATPSALLNQPATAVASGWTRWLLSPSAMNDVPAAAAGAHGDTLLDDDVAFREDAPELVVRLDLASLDDHGPPLAPTRPRNTIGAWVASLLFSAPRRSAILPTLSSSTHSYTISFEPREAQNVAARLRRISTELRILALQPAYSEALAAEPKPVIMGPSIASYFGFGGGADAAAAIAAAPAVAGADAATVSEAAAAAAAAVVGSGGSESTTTTRSKT